MYLAWNWKKVLIIIYSFFTKNPTNRTCWLVEPTSQSWHSLWIRFFNEIWKRFWPQYAENGHIDVKVSRDSRWWQLICGMQKNPEVAFKSSIPCKTLQVIMTKRRKDRTWSQHYSAYFLFFLILQSKLCMPVLFSSILWQKSYIFPAAAWHISSSYMVVKVGDNCYEACR